MQFTEKGLSVVPGYEVTQHVGYLVNAKRIGQFNMVLEESITR